MNTIDSAPERETTALRRLLHSPKIARTVGVSDAMSAMLGERHGFDAVWASGLAISAAYGVPDASILTMTEFLAAARVINHSTSIPVIADCDTGFGDVNVVKRMVREYEQAGIAGVCIEDKHFPKRNSFTSDHELASIKEFTQKIDAAKGVQTDPDFVVIARTESLIVGRGMNEALVRAQAYEAAGADAILIHSKSSNADEVLEFAGSWRSRGGHAPVIAVPTTYYEVTSTELSDAGIAMVIYANHALRAALQAIDSAFGRLRFADSTATIEPDLATIAEVFTLIGMDEISLVDIEQGTERAGDAPDRVEGSSRSTRSTRSA